VDLGTDMVPAISLAYEEKESDIMDRAPRNAATDRLVNRRLISFAYLQIGMMQALAGFFTYMVVLNDYGFAPWTLMGIGLEFEQFSLMCTVLGNGQPDDCGYGCDEPDDFEGVINGYDFKEMGNDYAYCKKGGCKIPFPASGAMDPSDPFLEFAVAMNNDTGMWESTGFRGYSTHNPCKRTCEWYNGLTGAEKNLTGTEMIVSPAEAAKFEMYCYEPGTTNGTISVNGMEYLKGRSDASERSQSRAPTGSFYWWAGKKQFFPNHNYQKNALAYAQTSYFISIIVVQWADLLIAKTRKLSLFDQGMANGFMNFGLCFETILGAILIYVPVFNLVFNTRPLHILHWFPGVPWSILIFTYDETRKFLMRRDPKGWLERFTYW